MKMVPMHDLKRRLAEFVAEAGAGTPILITKHRRAVAQLLPPTPHIHHGARVGVAAIEPLFRAPTKGRYAETIADDRRGGRAGG